MMRMWHTLTLSLMLASVLSCGESGNDPANGSCRLRCNHPEQDVCNEPASIPNFQAQRASWTSSICGASPAGAQFPFLVEGRCSNGARLLYTGGGTSAERRYYDADGRFLGLESGTDAGNGAGGDCREFSAYWPERIACGSGTVTQIHCGTILQLGDQIEPW
jgi:hypothetical protein